MIQIKLLQKEFEDVKYKFLESKPSASSCQKSFPRIGLTQLPHQQMTDHSTVENWRLTNQEPSNLLFEPKLTSPCFKIPQVLKSNPNDVQMSPQMEDINPITPLYSEPSQDGFGLFKASDILCPRHNGL